jgi:hypothetical protein
VVVSLKDRQYFRDELEEFAASARQTLFFGLRGYMRERYDSLIAFGIQASAKAALEQHAAREGLSMASYARRAVLAGLRQDQAAMSLPPGESANA